MKELRKIQRTAEYAARRLNGYPSRNRKVKKSRLKAITKSQPEGGRGARDAGTGGEEVINSEKFPS
jgi:hypothetical protein